MSTYYYLYCEVHKEAVFISDNKGDAFERADYMVFYLRHIISHLDSIIFIDEYGLAEIELVNPDVAVITDNQEDT